MIEFCRFPTPKIVFVNLVSIIDLNIPLNFLNVDITRLKPMDKTALVSYIK